MGVASIGPALTLDQWVSQPVSAGAWPAHLRGRGLAPPRLPQEPAGPAAAQREQPGSAQRGWSDGRPVRWARGTAAAASGFLRRPQGWREGATGLAAGMSLGVPVGPRPAPSRVEKQLRAGRGLVTRSPVQGLRGRGEGLAGCWRVPRCSLRVPDEHGEGASAGCAKRGSKAGRTVQTEAGGAESEASLGFVLKGERQKEGGLWVQVSKGGRKKKRKGTRASKERKGAWCQTVGFSSLILRTHKVGGENGLP